MVTQFVACGCDHGLAVRIDNLQACEQRLPIFASPTFGGEVYRGVGLHVPGVRPGRVVGSDELQTSPDGLRRVPARGLCTRWGRLKLARLHDVSGCLPFDLAFQLRYLLLFGLELRLGGVIVLLGNAAATCRCQQGKERYESATP
ncbi:MAG: hypothetical protein HY664_01980 [Chloroflexi bacterium]|nr:hypothetical protein [Chloroflexota bacterium]